ncbi:MAG: ATP-dependent zinc metalloprotease FtsH [Candidatus Paceibacterota bacterium]
MNKSLKDLGKNIAIVILVFFVASAVLAGLSGLGQTKDKSVSLSQLSKDINEGNVKKITVTGQKIEATYSDEKTIKETYKEEGSALTQTLKNFGVNEEALKRVDLSVQEQKQSTWDWLLPLLLYNLLPLLVIGFFVMQMFKQSKNQGGQVFDFSKARAKLFDKDKTKHKISFEDVGGLTEAKEELKEVVDFLKTPQKFMQIGARVPRGILLVGPTGTGKTLLARAIAAQANVPFFSISGSEFIELFVGVGAARVRDLFSTAKKHQPSIIFIDELDAIGGKRGPGFGGGHEEREQTLNQILVEMDGFERDSTCIILAATNRPDTLDAALLRPGRFDRRVVFDLPDVKNREEILNIHCKDKQIDNTIKLDEIAERTPGFSGADLANLVNEAALLAVKHNKARVGQTELLNSIDKVLLGPERKSHLLSTKEKEISAYHEAGHAIVNTFVPNGKDVRKVSIISRGMAGGYTLTLPKEERHFKTRTEFVSEIATLLGGYVAEKTVFNDITTGAGNDLEVASNIARSLVKEYGMSALGPITFGQREELMYLQSPEHETKNYSEKVAEKIDEEVANLIQSAQNEAQRLLNENRDLLMKTAKVLIEKETIEKEDFEELIKADKGPRALKARTKKQE